MKHGGMPGAYGGTHGCGKHGCPFQYVDWFGGHTVIGSASAGAATGRAAAATSAAVITAMTARGFAAKARGGLNRVVARMLLNNSG